MSKYIVRFTPAYTNKPKEVECTSVHEAQLLLEWFNSVNTPSEIILVEVKETILSDSSRAKASV